MGPAVLVLAHKDKNQLNKLITHLAPDFDVFIHLDKKASLRVEEIASFNNVFIVKKYPVYWGSFNQIKATLELLKVAFSKNYDRYLLISGQDVPVKSNKEIKEYFKWNNNEFIECTKLPCKFWADGGVGRLSKYHPLDHRGVYGIRRYFVYINNLFFRFVNSTLKLERKMDYTFYGGTSWFNLTNDSVARILEYIKGNPNYLNRYKFTRCGDEIFFQTVVMNVGIKNGIINSSLRYIDWNTGPEFPRILRISDYGKIVRSGMLFARKIDESIDAEISDRLYSIAEKKA